MVSQYIWYPSISGFRVYYFHRMESIPGMESILLDVEHSIGWRAFRWMESILLDVEHSIGWRAG